MLHEAESGSERPAVLICAPWGWEETASYRGRRTWAQRLAADGHPTLRFDFPSAGDSSGAPGDPGRVAAWTAAVSNAAAWLRARSERSQLAALGLGFGGLIAMAALDGGAAIDQLVLWAAPTRGRRFVREVDSFAKMQAWGEGRGEDSPLPEGWVEAGGFLLSGETVADLKSLKALEQVPPGLERALLLDRDGMELDAGLAERLREAGVEASAAAGPGWGKMVFHPEHAILPEETIARVGEWLAAAPAAAGPAAAAEAGEGALELELSQGCLRETPLAIDQRFGRAFGVLAEPLGERRGDFTVVFLNAGAVRHIGPNRNWVESARRWAARGVPSARLDLEGIGEADGDGANRTGVAGFYSGDFGSQVTAALDALEARGLGSNFVCVGLCSGAYWSLQMAARDPRVSAAALLNAGALVWHEDLRAARESRLVLGGIFQAESWRRLWRGEVDLKLKLAAITRLTGMKLRLLWKRLRGKAEPHRPADEIEALFDRLQSGGKRVAMGFCANEPVLLELEQEGILGRLERWPAIELSSLVGEDHALGPVAAQRSGAELIDREIERALARAGERTPVGLP